MGGRPTVGVTQFVAKQGGVSISAGVGARVGQDQALARRAGIGFHPNRRRTEQGVTHRIDPRLAGELDGDGAILLKARRRAGIAEGRGVGGGRNGGGKKKLKH
jgi:hypothetical protein